MKEKLILGERLDKVLVERKLLKSRSQATMLIRQGDILVNGKKETKSSKLIEDSDEIEIKTRDIFVGRGALKLLHAIKEFDLDFANKTVADCGASTGGFTQVALQNGALRVYAIDVGHGQLDETLKNDIRVENIEGVNLKNEFKLSELVDYCVVDLSFISLKLTYPNIAKLLKPGGYSVVLIKPQFEAGNKERLGKGGIVKPQDVDIIRQEVVDWFVENNFKIVKLIDSPIYGKDGNKEFLALIS